MIELSDKLLSAIRKHGEQTYPNECCGILIGHEQDGRKNVVALFPVENASEAAEQYHRYLITTHMYMQAEKQARSMRCDVIGFYHSHPEDEARPSEVDREHAWPWYSYIVVSIRQGRAGAILSWRFDEGRRQFNPEEISTRR